ncbi:unnamed protein product [Rhizophagus irregularis]|nr:unnamed protein product [Rhizophagus irregularis]
MENIETSGWIEEAITNNHIRFYEYDKFTCIEEIGSGSFGKEIVNELKLQREVDFHDNIIRFHGITKPVSEDKKMKDYHLVLEYANQGTLESYLDKNFENLTWNDKYKMAHQLACAVLCLHDEGIVHNDLNSSNILVHQHDIKLADFGLSKRLDESSRLQSKVFGVIPYTDPKKFIMEISGGLRETIVPNTPTDYVKLYEECWDSEPSKRPNMEEVVKRLKTNIQSDEPPHNNNRRNSFNSTTSEISPLQEELAQLMEKFNKMITKDLDVSELGSLHMKLSSLIEKFNEAAASNDSSQFSSNAIRTHSSNDCLLNTIEIGSTRSTRSSEEEFTERDLKL